MERLLLNSLIEWKNSPYRKPLILRGARQIGKTWLLQHFGASQYKYVAYINCDNDPLAKTLFSDYDTARILRTVEVITKVPIIPGETLIVFDEIQEQRNGLHALKYFNENASEFHIAATGSLLGLLLHQHESFPVGKVDILNLYPMDFAEFLLALGERQLVELLNTEDWPVISSLSSKYQDLLRQYYYVGGMPEAVMAYISKRPLIEIRKIQENILEAYRLDISKHAPTNDILRINQVFRSIPAHLSKENKKFVFGALRKGARAADFEKAIQWLVDAGIVYKINRINNGILPLNIYEDYNAFKLYLLDCGLYGAMNETPVEAVLLGDDIFREYKGSFTEQYVLEQLIVHYKHIYYFSASDSQVEVDFIFQKEGRIIPLEVKAEENLRSKSLKYFVEKFSIAHGVRTSMSGFRQQEWLKNIPLWAIGRL